VPRYVIANATTGRVQPGSEKTMTDAQASQENRDLHVKGIGLAYVPAERVQGDNVGDWRDYYYGPAERPAGPPPQGPGGRRSDRAGWSCAAGPRSRRPESK
jgi:hypothetical protein